DVADVGLVLQGVADGQHTPRLSSGIRNPLGVQLCGNLSAALFLNRKRSKDALDDLHFRLGAGDQNDSFALEILSLPKLKHGLRIVVLVQKQAAEAVSRWAASPIPLTDDVALTEEHLFRKLSAVISRAHALQVLEND